MAWTFCGSFIFADGEVLCFIGKNHVRLNMTGSFINETSAWGRIFHWKDWKDKKEGIKEFEFLLFPSSIFSIVLQRGGTQLVDD